MNVPLELSFRNGTQSEAVEDLIRSRAEGAGSGDRRYRPMGLPQKEHHAGINYPVGQRLRKVETHRLGVVVFVPDCYVLAKDQLNVSSSLRDKERLLYELAQEDRAFQDVLKMMSQGPPLDRAGEIGPDIRSHHQRVGPFDGSCLKLRQSLCHAVEESLRFFGDG